MKVQLAKDGMALMPIVIPPEAPGRIVEAANDLREKLDQITGASFEVATGDSHSGIYLGVEPRDDPFDNGVFTLETHEGGLRIIGASALGVMHGVWGFLKDLGYRQFFPENLWEHIPNIPTLEAEYSRTEIPSFVIRRGPKEPAWSDRALWADWRKKNRMVADVSISTGHVWGNIIRRNQEIFDANPQFLNGGKFRVSAVGEWEGKPLTLVQLVVNYAIEQFQENPGRASVSMDPTDGTGDWSRDEEELNFKPGEHGYTDPSGGSYENYDGSHITDRVVFLANEVAKAINELGLGRKFVGYYAYAAHKEGPNIPVHPNHVVSVVGSFTAEAPQWRDMGARNMGTYVRLHLVQSHRGDLPGPRGGNISYAERTIPAFHNMDCRIFIGDSYDSWGINGLPYYLNSHKLWDVESDIEKEIVYFLETMFGDAAGVMEGYFDMINRKYEFPPRTRQDYLARGYRILQEAYYATEDPSVRERIDYLTLYLFYVELYHHHRRASSSQETGETMCRHAYRMTQRQLSLITALYNLYVERSSRPMEPTYEQMEEFNFRRPLRRMEVGGPLTSIMPWTDGTPFTDEEIEGMRLNGIANFEPEDFGFEPKEFSNDLRPVAPLNLPTVSIGENVFVRGYNSCHLWLEEGQKLHLMVRMRAVREPNDMFMHLESDKEVLDQPVQTQTITADDAGVWKEVIFTSPYTGRHFLHWNARSDWGEVTWPDVIVSGTGTDADGLYSRTRTRTWRNGAGWRIHRDSSRDPWSLINPEGEVMTQGDSGASEPIDARWDGIMEGLEVGRYSEQKIVWEFSPNNPNDWSSTNNTWSYYFYVPKGTKVVGGVFDNHSYTAIFYPDGSSVPNWRTEDGDSGPFAIDVPEGMDGQLWRIYSNRGGRSSLLTVPPYVARSAEELLLPREVIEADAGIELPDEDDNEG